MLRSDVGPPSSTRWDTLLALAVLLGVGLRIAGWWFDRSLWLDEAMLAIQIRDRGYGALLERLGMKQGAPYGYLVVERTCLVLFGSGERSLRLPAVVAGCLSVPVMAHLCKNWFGSARQALPAVVAFAVAYWPVNFASEIKQYSFELLAAVVLLWVTSSLAARADIAEEGRWWRLAALAGVAAPWFAFSAVFVMAGCGLHLLLRFGGTHRGRRRSGGLAAAWLASLVGAYFLSMANAVAIGRHPTWAPGYWPSGGAWDSVRWLGSVLVGVMDNPLASPWPVVSAVALTIGLLLPSAGGLRPQFIGTAGTLLAASALGLYSIRWRLMLFAVPLVLGLLNRLAVALCRPLGRVSSAFAIVLVLALAGVGAIRSFWSEGRGALARNGDPRTLLRSVAGRFAPGDVFVPTDYTYPLSDYYRQKEGLPFPKQVHLLRTAAEGGAVVEGEIERCPRGITWIVSAYSRSHENSRRLEASLREALDAGGAAVLDTVRVGSLFALKTAIPEVPGRSTEQPQ